MQVGKKFLITCNEWFYAPDGENYKAVFGTVHAVVNDDVALGIKTNAKSSNWFVSIGDMIVAGCQIQYAQRANKFNPKPSLAEIDHNGERHISSNATTRIYDADASGFRALIDEED